jgi:hypothetical protein
MNGDATAYQLKLRNRKSKKSMTFSLSMPELVPLAPEVEDRHALWGCDYEMRRGRRTVREKSYGATWLDAMTGAAEGMRRLIPVEEERDWVTEDGIESWRIFPKLVAADGNGEGHVSVDGEAAARQREGQAPDSDLPPYALTLRNRKRRRSLHFTMTMPGTVPRAVWDRTDHPLWACTVTVVKRGKPTSWTLHGEDWTGAIVNAFKLMRRMIPEDEECEWETPEGLPSWCVLPRIVPIGWGYDLYHRISRATEDIRRTYEDDVQRRRLAWEKKRGVTDD